MLMLPLPLLMFSLAFHRLASAFASSDSGSFLSLIYFLIRFSETKQSA